VASSDKMKLIGPANSQQSALRYLTEGQKAVLANNYSKILSKKLNEDKNNDQPRDEKGRFLPLEETVSTNGDEEKDRSRKMAAERWKVSEWKVRMVQEIEEAGKKAVTIREIKRGNIDEATVASTMNEDQDRSRKEASNKFNRGNILGETVSSKIN